MARKVSRKFTVGQLYIVQWRDHHVPDISSPWIPIKDVKQEDCQVNTAGYCILDNAQFVCLAQSVGAGADLSDKTETVGAPMMIAKDCITQVFEVNA